MGRGNAEMAPMPNPGRRRKEDPLDLRGFNINAAIGKADFRPWEEKKKPKALAQVVPPCRICGMRAAKEDGLCSLCRNRNSVNKKREIEKFLRDLFKEDALEKTIDYDYLDNTLSDHLIETYLDTLEDNDYILSWSALLHDIGKPFVAWQDEEGRRRYDKNPDDPVSLDHAEAGASLAEDILRKQEITADDRKEILYLIKHHGYKEDRGTAILKEESLSEKARRFIEKHGRSRALRLLRLREADPEGYDMDDIRAFQDAVFDILAREEAG